MSTPNSSNIVLRSDVERPLLHGEMDLNFTEVKNVIDQSNQNKSDVAGHYVTTRSLLTRSYAEAGITVADGSFEQGVTGVTKGTGVYQESTGKVFQWQLTNTFNITAGTLPSDYGTIGTDWVDRSQSTLKDMLSSDSGDMLGVDLFSAYKLGTIGAHLVPVPGGDNTGVIDSTANFNASLLKIAISGGGVLKPIPGIYKILGVVLLPTNVVLDLTG